MKEKVICPKCNSNNIKSTKREEFKVISKGRYDLLTIDVYNDCVECNHKFNIQSIDLR